MSQFGQVPQVFEWIPPQAKEMLGHLGLFLFLGLFVARYLWEMGFRTVMALLMTVLLCAGYGVFDEFHQYFVADRGVEVSDFAVDLVGGLAGGLIYILWTRLRPGQGQAIRNEVQTEVLLKQGGVALTLFAFILLPAAVYSCSITGLVRSVASRDPVRVEVASKNHALTRPERQARKQPTDIPPVVTRPQNQPDKGDNIQSESATMLIEFVQVVNLLSKRRDEMVVAMKQQNRAGGEFAESWRNSRLAVKEKRNVP